MVLYVLLIVNKVDCRTRSRRVQVIPRSRWRLCPDRIREPVCLPSRRHVGVHVEQLLRPPKSTLSDDDDIDDRHGSSDDETTATPSTQFAFPELDAQIRAAIEVYGGVFPKLNFSSPKARSPFLFSASVWAGLFPPYRHLRENNNDFPCGTVSFRMLLGSCRRRSRCDARPRRTYTCC